MFLEWVDCNEEGFQALQVEFVDDCLTLQSVGWDETTDQPVHYDDVLTVERQHTLAFSRLLKDQLKSRDLHTTMHADGWHMWRSHPAAMFLTLDAPDPAINTSRTYVSTLIEVWQKLSTWLEREITLRGLLDKAGIVPATEIASLHYTLRRQR